MNRTYGNTGAAAAVLIAAAMLFTGVPFLTEGSDAQGDVRTYGDDCKSFDWREVDRTIEEIFGQTFERILEDAVKDEYGYDMNMETPHLKSEMVSKREVTTSGDICTVQDHVSAYLELGTSFTIRGHLPEAGTYEREEGETTEDFIGRVISGHAEKDEREIAFELAFMVYLDIDLRTEMDSSTGELTRSDVNAKAFIVEYEHNNLSLETEEDEENINVLTIGYEEQESSTNIYLGTGLDLRYEGLNISADTDIQPMVTAHIDHVYVSADTAQGLMDVISHAQDMDGKIKNKLPQLILNIIKSGNRVLDLIETMKSLTGTRLNDIDLNADITVSDAKDGEGNDYKVLQINRDGADAVKIPLSVSKYCFGISDLLGMIPDSIIPQEMKAYIGIGAGILGWDEFRAKEMTPDMQVKYDTVHEHTVEMIKYDETYELNIPTEYIVIQAVELAAFAGLVFYLRRQQP